jgi:hypothetical protein
MGTGNHIIEAEEGVVKLRRQLHVAAET